MVKSIVSNEVKRPDSTTVVTDAASYAEASRQLSGDGIRQVHLVEDVLALDIPALYSVKGTQLIHHTRVVNGAL